MKICNSQKYVWNRGYIHMPISISKEDLPEEISVKENTLLVKDEFHVSLFCNKNIPQSAYEKFPNIEEKILEIFCEIADQKEVSIEKISPEFRFAQKETDRRKSLIVMVSVKNLNAFYDKINSEFNLSLEYPPTHISLYTLEKNKAIGINNSQDLDHLTESVEMDLHVK